MFVGTSVWLFRNAASAQAWITKTVNNGRSAPACKQLISFRTFSVRIGNRAIGAQTVGLVGKHRVCGAVVFFARGQLFGSAIMGRTDGQDVRATVIANARALDKRMTAVLSGHAPR